MQEQLNFLVDLFRRYKTTGVILAVLTSLTVMGTVIPDATTFEAAITATQADFDNIQLNGNTISTTDTDGDLILTPDGTGDVILSSGTANTVMILDVSKQLVSSVVTDTELALLSGVTGIVTIDGVETLTNKTIDGDDNTLQDMVAGIFKTDIAKANTFFSRDGSGIGIATKVVPGGAVVGTSDTQTLDAKTIDGDTNTIIDLPVTAIKTEAGSPNVFISRNGSGVPIDTKAVPTGAVVGISDSQTLTNKTIDGDDNTVQDLGIASIKTEAGSPNVFITRNGSGVPIETKLVPTGVVVGLNDAQTLTNKVMTAAGNTFSGFTHGTEVNNPSSAVHGVAGTIVGTSDGQTLTNKAIDGDDNSVTDLGLTNLKTVLAQANNFLSRDGAGVPIDTKAVPTGAVIGTTDSQTLTNKTIDGDLNTVQDLGIASIKTEAGSPDVFISRNGSGVPIETKAVPTGAVIGTIDTQTLTNKTIDSSLNTITNIVNADVSASAAIARTKIANGTINHVIINDGSGVLSSEAQLAISRGGTGQSTQTPAFDALAPNTTKGDLIIHNGTDNIRLGIGSNSQVLTADSGEASGAKWTTLGAASAANLLINGNMDLWQRGTSFTSITDSYSADMWKIKNSGTTAVMNVTRDGSVPTGANSIFSYRVSVTTADTSVAASDEVTVRYTLEGPDLDKISGKAFNISFYVKSSETGTHCVAMRNESSARSYPATYTVSVADTWEEKSIDITHDITGTWDQGVGGIGARIDWVLMAGSTLQGTADTWQAGNILCTAAGANVMDAVANNFHLTRVRITAGSGQKDFALSGGSLAGEMDLVQRYYEKSYNYDTAPGTSTSTGALWTRMSGLTSGGHSIRATVQFKSVMAKVPTMVFHSTTGTAGNCTVTPDGNRSAASIVTSTSSAVVESSNSTATGDLDMACQYTADASL